MFSLPLDWLSFGVSLVLFFYILYVVIHMHTCANAYIHTFPSRSWCCQCPCGCGTVVRRYIITIIHTYTTAASVCASLYPIWCLTEYVGFISCTIVVCIAVSYSSVRLLCASGSHSSRSQCCNTYKRKIRKEDLLQQNRFILSCRQPMRTPIRSQSVTNAYPSPTQS